MQQQFKREWADLRKGLVREFSAQRRTHHKYSLLLEGLKALQAKTPATKGGDEKE